MEAAAQASGRSEVERQSSLAPRNPPRKISWAPETALVFIFDNFIPNSVISSWVKKGASTPSRNYLTSSSPLRIMILPSSQTETQSTYTREWIDIFVNFCTTFHDDCIKSKVINNPNQLLAGVPQIFRLSCAQNMLGNCIFLWF